MRNSVLPIVIAVLVFVSAGVFVSWVFFTREREFRKVDVPASWLETADTSRFSVQPVLLGRNYPDDSVLVLFPKTNKKSQVFIYDQKNYYRLLFGDHRGNPIAQPNAEGYAALFGRPVLNLSNYPQGKYYVHVTSCSFGGFLEIELLDSLR
ncbi:MAG TPA: hypothetical protein VI731_01495 [Bacteroidia bacterium]|nr:hypothetical protein [Bacteroidia bacterium]